MFEGDDNVFTDERFKHYSGAEIYAGDRVNYAAFSPKHAGQDWFFYWQNNIAGIMHLYDLSLETLAGNNKRCWIGFAIKPELRNKGITKKAARIFIDYIFSNYSFIEYIHAMVENDNKVSQHLLCSLNFKRDTVRDDAQAYHFYVCQKAN
jgi:RimJ/RimL family protein N-acetyltransferase